MARQPEEGCIFHGGISIYSVVRAESVIMIGKLVIYLLVILQIAFWNGPRCKYYHISAAGVSTPFPHSISTCQVSASNVNNFLSNIIYLKNKKF